MNRMVFEPSSTVSLVPAFFKQDEQDEHDRQDIVRAFIHCKSSPGLGKSTNRKAGTSRKGAISSGTILSIMFILSILLKKGGDQP